MSEPTFGGLNEKQIREIGLYFYLANMNLLIDGIDLMAKITKTKIRPIKKWTLKDWRRMINK